MLLLKQILHSPLETISELFSTIKTDLQSLGVAPQNLVLAENLGKLLYCLILLVSIVALTAVTFISSLLSLLKMTLMKLRELWTLTEVPGFNVQYILCRLADVRKSITSMLKKSPKHVWSEVGASHQDYTSAYSEMPGELEEVVKYKNEQHEKAMKAEIKKPLDAELREKGLI